MVWFRQTQERTQNTKGVVKVKVFIDKQSVGEVAGWADEGRGQAYLPGDGMVQLVLAEAAGGE